jgi:hypothetical protein
MIILSHNDLQPFSPPQAACKKKEKRPLYASFIIAFQPQTVYNILQDKAKSDAHKIALPGNWECGTLVNNISANKTVYIF